MADELVAGLDVGTQGARLIMCDDRGNIVAEAYSPLRLEIEEELPPGWSEQDPDDWWTATKECIEKVRKSLSNLQDIIAITVDSTSGTVVPIGEDNIPLRRAIMYNDNRSQEEADIVNDYGRDIATKLGYKFKPSFALPKMLWIKRNEPDIFEKVGKFLHAADFLAGKLTGDYSHSDTSNSLKAGYDLVDDRWPKFIFDKLDIPEAMLPQVVKPGTIIGHISKEIAWETGLSESTKVSAGATDGTASFLSSSAVKVGEFNTTLGTTLVVRGVSPEVIRDEKGRIYCHAHPEGYWLPGGASSTGGECLAIKFKGRELEKLDREAMNHIPTNLLIYPLVRKGERLPFNNTSAQGFIVGDPKNEAKLYAGYLEGVGFVERWIYDVLEELGAVVGERIYTSGGGSKSKEWIQIRADILNKTLVRPRIVESAFGAALISASAVLYEGFTEAAQNMVQIDTIVNPDPERAEIYQERYRKFREECSIRGYY